MSKYRYELLIIDTDGKSQIKTVKSLSHALIGTDILWNKPIIEDKESSSCCLIKDTDIKLTIKAIDSADSFTDLVESAFLVDVSSTNFEIIEKFRYNLLLRLKSKIGFNNIRILTDDISTELSQKIYPIINNVENILRRYIALFFTLKIGVKWFGLTVPTEIQGKINMRKDNEQVFSKLVDTDVTLIDFNDLGEIIYKQNTGFNNQQNIVEKIMNLESIEDITNLKTAIQNNYTKYFKESFQSFGFDSKWKTLFAIRNKVAHNNLFTSKDLQDAIQIGQDLIKIIEEAEKNINSFAFSIEEQESIIQATIDSENTHNTTQSESNDTPANIPKVIGQIEIPIQSSRYVDQSKILEILKSTTVIKYIGLKYFATVVLPQNGYESIPANYAVVNVLKNKGEIDIYDEYDSELGYIVKAIKLITHPTHQS